MKTRSKSLIDEALEAWAYTRQGVMAEMKNLPESALDFKPSEASRTTRALMQHIIESGLLMAGELPRPDGDFQRKPYAELSSVPASAPKITDVRSRLKARSL